MILLICVYIMSEKMRKTFRHTFLIFLADVPYKVTGSLQPKERPTATHLLHRRNDDVPEGALLLPPLAEPSLTRGRLIGRHEPQLEAVVASSSSIRHDAGQVQHVPLGQPDRAACLLVLQEDVQLDQAVVAGLAVGQHQLRSGEGKQLNCYSPTVLTNKPRTIMLKTVTAVVGTGLANIACCHNNNVACHMI